LGGVSGATIGGVAWALEPATNPSILLLHTSVELTDLTIDRCPPSRPPPPLATLLEVPGVRSIELHRYRARLNLEPGVDPAHVGAAVRARLADPWGPPEAPPAPPPRSFPGGPPRDRTVAESAEMARGQPVLQALFQVPGVAEAILEQDGTVTVRLGRLFTWEEAEDEVRAAIGPSAVHPTERRVQGLEARVERAIGRLYMALERNRVTRTPWVVIQTFSRAQGSLLSGSMAYFTFLSLPPLLMVSAFVLAAISNSNPGLQEALITAVGQVFPGIEGRELLDQLIRARVAFGILGLVTLAYAGSGFVGALTASLNRMWNVASGRNPIGQKLVNLLAVLLLGGVLLGSAGLTIWVGYLTRAALGEDAGLYVAWVERIASPLAMFAILLVLYRALPARTLSVWSQVPGAILCALGVELLKRVFTFWAQHSAGISALPRSLVSVVLLLLWLGFFAQLILYGAALNVVLDRRRRGLSPLPES
jgi:membrane protein